MAGDLGDGAWASRVDVVIDRSGGGIVGVECGGGVRFDLRDPGDWFYVGGDGEVVCLSAGGGGGGGVGHGTLAGSGWIESGFAQCVGGLGFGECRGVLESVGGIFLLGGGGGGSGDGVVAIGGAGGGGGVDSGGAGGGVVRVVGVCGKAGGDCGAFALWGNGDGGGDAWGYSFKRDMVFDRGTIFGAGISCSE